MAPPADAVLSFVSGIPLILLGALLLFIRPWRAPQVYFGVFAVLWGLQVVTANVGRLFDDVALHARMLLVTHVFMIVATLFLTHFAARVRPRPFDWVPTAVMGTTVVAAFIVYVTDPSLLVRSVERTADGISTTYGPLMAPLVQVPFFAAFGLAIFVLYRAYRRARPGTHRHRLRGMLLALALFAAYQYVRTTVAFLDFGGGFAEFASGAVRTSSGFSDLVLVVGFSTGAVLLFALVAYAYLRPPPPEERDLPLLLAFLFPAGVALLEDVLADQGVVRLETLGFWRLVSVGVLAYTLANHQLFDLDLKLKRVAAPGTAGIFILFGIPFTLGMAQGDFGVTATVITLLPEIIGIGAVLVFHNRLQERLFPGVKDSADYVHQRKVELYRVALDDALGRGKKSDDPELTGLRTRYGISLEEHRMLVWMTDAHHSAKEAGTIDFTPGAVVLDRYQIVRRIGQGTHRTTYLATDVKSHQYVAIKAVATHALDGAVARLLVREARLAASIGHPNVLAVFDVSEEHGVALIVMDYADQGNLEDLLRRRGRPDHHDATRMLAEILSGLAAIHAKGIVHRNLKPKNVLIDADGSILISDLSAARADDPTTPEDERFTAPTDPSEALAADALLDILYLSPEQVQGRHAGPQSDLYAAAVLFHHILTGRHYLPIAGRSDHQIRHLILEHTPALELRDAPSWVAPFLRRALAKDPEERYSDAMTMLEALRREAGVHRPRVLATAAVLPPLSYF